MEASTFRLRVWIERSVRIGTSTLDREAFYAWVWETLASDGLIGVHEGTLLSDEAAEAGLKTESWELDAGEAPRERDWVGSREGGDAELYFSSEEGARAGAARLAKIGGVRVGGIEEQKPQDWDAEWKASFKGVQVKPFWHVVPPWEDPPSTGTVIRLNPGAGFGTGTHETTQLCLQALGGLGSLEGRKVLDFGSGSGILAIAAALLGARADAVEIDPLAIDNATENARLNAMEDRIRFARTFAELEGARGPYQVVLANILRPVLLEFSEELCARLASPGTLILSGLIEGDVAPIIERFGGTLGAGPAEVLAQGEWRAIVWRRGS